MKRSSGVLLHISSLPGPYGIGTLGEEAFRFADKLAEAGVRYWQVLPLCTVGPSNSPYSSISCFANNELLIDPRVLAAEGYLTEDELKTYVYDGSPSVADYDFARENSARYLRLAFSRLDDARYKELLAFVNAESSWLVDYAMFVVLRETFKEAAWQTWPKPLAWRDEQALSEFSLTGDHMESLEYVYFCQWQFRRQWDSLRKYCNARGLGLIGDMPIFPALDSADVWASPEQFQLDEAGQPTAKAGVPPDYFAEDGQLWGNPLYDWERIEAEEFRWWVDRVRYSMDLYDVVRIDHFRGFESYWAVPAESETARHGVWRKGPGIRLFRKLHEKIDPLEIIAEDLGDINEDVERLVEDTGYPGMKVLQFAFDDKEWAQDLPYRYRENRVVYTGTHDNNTVLGWLRNRPEDVRTFALDYVRMPEGADWEMKGPRNPAVRSFIEACWSTSGILAVAPLQDFLGMGDEARMNVPGTDTDKNWVFRVTAEELEAFDTAWLRRLNVVFQRLAPQRPVFPDEEKA